MQHVLIESDFSLPPERIFAWLAEHENLNLLFAPVKVTRRNDGTDGTRNGLGSARDMSLFGLSKFVETNTEVVPNERIAYRITEGGPLKDHAGLMVLTPKGTGTHLKYTIDFGSKVPGVDVVLAQALKRSVTKGLREVDAKA